LLRGTGLGDVTREGNGQSLLNTRVVSIALPFALLALSSEILFSNNQKLMLKMGFSSSLAGSSCDHVSHLLANNFCKT
jgi:hypothetical protein